MSRSNAEFHAIVLGEESAHNLRLSTILRKLIGKEHVYRFLVTKHLFEFIAENDTVPTAIFLDLFSLDLEKATQSIGFIRQNYPIPVFCIYTSTEERNKQWNDLPAEWRSRLDHYFRLFKQPEDTELEPVVRRVLDAMRTESEGNATGKPTKLTKNILDKFSLPETPNQKKKLFISYSRLDWDEFVSPLVNRLQDLKFSVWVDQHLLIGGDDWMDKLGQALYECNILVLVMSPDALKSKYVKMEYRYFFNHDKVIIPLLHRRVNHVPPELSGIQYINFVDEEYEDAFKKFIGVLKNIKLDRPKE